MQQVIDWLLQSEKDLIVSVVNESLDGLTEKKCQWTSWKAGNKQPNPVNYGALSPFVKAVERAQNDQGRKWIKRHVKDSVEIFWRCMAYNGNPPGEGMSIDEAGNVVNWDSDYRRHVTIAGFVDAALQYPELVPLVKPMAEKWGEWLLDYNLPKHAREYHRFGYQLDSLVAIYQITRDPAWLNYAKAFFWWAWGKNERIVENEAGNEFSAWDTGAWNEDRGSYMAHMTTYAYQVNPILCAWIRLYQHGDVGIKNCIADRVMKWSEWYLKDDKCPPILSPETWANDWNTPLRGIVFDNPKDWLTLADDEDYARMLTFEVHETGGQYGDEWFYNSDGDPVAKRDHHQDKLEPVLRAGGSGFGLPTIFFARYLTELTEENKLWSLWALHDYRGFCCYMSPDKVLNKSMRMGNPWGGAQGRSRGLAWWLMSGLHVMEGLD